MTIWDDMIRAVEDYPETYVELEIVEADTVGDMLMVGEIMNFSVKVTNTEPLHLDNVTLRIKGMNDALVKSANVLAQFEEEFVTQELPRIKAHGGSQTTAGTFRLKAPGAAQASRMLVKATLEAWNANLDHIMNGHSDPHADAPPKGTYAAPVMNGTVPVPAEAAHRSE